MDDPKNLPVSNERLARAEEQIKTLFRLTGETSASVKAMADAHAALAAAWRLRRQEEDLSDIRTSLEAVNSKLDALQGAYNRFHGAILAVAALISLAVSAIARLWRPV